MNPAAARRTRRRLPRVTTWESPGPRPADSERPLAGAAPEREDNKSSKNQCRAGSGPVPERNRRSVSTSVMVTKKVPDVPTESGPSGSLPAFLHQADATAASEFLAQFSYSHYVDSATVTHGDLSMDRPSSEPESQFSPSQAPGRRRPPSRLCAVSPQSRQPSSRHPHLNITLSQPSLRLHADCVTSMALAPGLVVTVTSRSSVVPRPASTDRRRGNLPYFRKIALLSEAVTVLCRGRDRRRCAAAAGGAARPARLSAGGPPPEPGRPSDSEPCAGSAQ